MSIDKNNKHTNNLSWSLGSAWNKASGDTPFHEKGREGVIQDYLKFYVETGIMDYFTQKVQSDFGIPHLDPSRDLHLIAFSEQESDITEEEKSDWYEELSQDKKEELDKRVKEIMRKLYLPSGSFTLLLRHFLYRGKLKTLNSLFDEYMIECIAFGVIPEREMLGYKKTEIKWLETQAILYLKYAQREKILRSDLTDKEKQEELQWTEKQIELVPKRCQEILKNLERKKKPLKTLEEDILIMSKLKDYKSQHEEFDPFVGLTSKWKETSQYIIEELHPEMPIRKLKKAANNFRKHVERLIKKYPFIPDVIAYKKT